MSFKRVATLDVQSVYASDQNGKFMWREFVKKANENPSEDRSKFLPKEAYKYDTDHFLFLTARAISGMEKHGHNGNYDAFPWEEIKKALPTYPGCGFYIEHKEDSFDDAKGIVLDVFPNEDEQYVTCLCAIDKDDYPEFVQQILDGTYSQVSMSLLANECECSECGNVAHSFEELCQHMNPNMPVTYMKGKTNDKGEDIYEINRDLCFTGLSAVAVPADKEAFIFDIKASKKKENKLQQELVKYQNIKQAAKMKEFRTACEEEFKALDTVALLNKLQNCATAITNQVVDQQTGAEVINGPLQGILKELMELQIGLTILDLNKLAAPVVDNTVAVEGEPQTEMPEITTNTDNQEPLTMIEDDSESFGEEVNFDKEIDSMLKQIKSDNNLYSGPNIIDAYKNLQKAQVSLKTLFDAGFISQEKFNSSVSQLEDLTSMLYAPVFKNRKVNLDKEIDSMLKQADVFKKGVERNIEEFTFNSLDDMLSFIKQHGKTVVNIKIMQSYKIPEKYKVIGTFLTDEEIEQLTTDLDKEIDSYLDGDNWSYTPFNSTASLDKIIEKTYK